MKYSFLIWPFIFFAISPGLHGQDTGIVEEDEYAVLRFHSEFEKNRFSASRTGQDLSMVDLYLMADQDNNFEKARLIKDDIEQFLSKLQKKQRKYDEDKLLKHVFYKTHRKFLKNYQNHSPLKEVFDNGSYDCLSGTSLYVLLLDALGYTYQIKETDYHIYLIVEAEENQFFLFEATDPLGGFVSDPEEIKSRQRFYSNPASGQQASQFAGVSSNKQEFRFSTSVNNRITKVELAGLHYYNKAVECYNKQQYSEAIQLLQKALILYDSARIKEFLSLVVEVSGENNNLCRAITTK